LIIKHLRGEPGRWGILPTGASLALINRKIFVAWKRNQSFPHKSIFFGIKELKTGKIHTQNSIGAEGVKIVMLCRKSGKKTIASF
jgi:hypothetical protein